MHRLKNLLIIILLYSLNSQAIADGFDNSYFPFQIFTGSSRIETSLTLTDATVKPNIQAETVTLTSGTKVPTQAITTNDMYNNRYSPVFGLHYKCNDNLYLNFQYDEPFATDTSYEDDSVGPGFPLRSKIETSMYSLGFTQVINRANQLYSLISGIQILRGDASFSADGYAGLSCSANSSNTCNDNIITSLDIGNNLGYFFGFAYEIPKIALKLQLMYYPEIDAIGKGTLSVGNDFFSPFNITVSAPITADVISDNLAVSPNRIHLYLQTGLNEKTLGFIGYSSVNWKALPTLNTNYTDINTTDTDLKSLFPTAGSINLFEDDAVYWYVGAGYQVNTQLALSFTAFIDTIRDSPVESFRSPGRGTHSYHLGTNFDLDEKNTVSGRLGYIYAPSTDIVYPVSATIGTGEYKATVDPDVFNFHIGYTRKL